MRTVKARALTEDHLGRLASHDGASTPLRLLGCAQSLTRAYLYWEGGIDTCVLLDADITLHDDGDGG